MVAKSYTSNYFLSHETIYNIKIRPHCKIYTKSFLTRTKMIKKYNIKVALFSQIMEINDLYKYVNKNKNLKLREKPEACDMKSGY